MAIEIPTRYESERRIGQEEADMIENRRIVIAVATIFFVALVGPGEATADAGIPDLSGTWAQKIVLSSVSDPPVVGTVKSTTTTYLLYEIRQRDREVEIERTICDVQMESDSSMVEPELPNLFVDALPEEDRAGRIDREGGSAVLVVERSESVLGADLRAPISERLPTSAEDSRVTDVDGDGEPGATVRIRGIVSGEIYVVQRAWNRFRGRLDSTGRIAGRVEWQLDQEVVGSSSIFLRNQPPTRPHPDGAKSYFEMVRVDSGATCSELMGSTRIFEGRGPS